MLEALWKIITITFFLKQEVLSSRTSSPRCILRLELMMILWPLSKVTASAMQLGAQEWLMYLRGERKEIRKKSELLPD